jgi:uncharacterized damage-inducible protein DinB
METQTTPAKEIFIKMVLDAWEVHYNRVNNLINKLSDEKLLKDTAPGRNSGLYLLGHLTAVNDRILVLLGGERLFPELDNAFISNPDKSGIAMPSVAEVRSYWNKVNEKLNQHFSKLSSDEWFTRHTSVSEEDFAKEPHRNKLNLLINRTNHQSYHLGQLAYLGEKKND